MPKVIAKSEMRNIKNFVQEFGNAALKVQEETGVSALALLAQMALETGWGDKVLKVYDATTGEMVGSKNFFNIKATPEWKGRKGWANVPEYVNGQKIISKEWFRIYETYEDSLKDYLQLIQSLTRYQDAWVNRADPFAYMEAIVKGGYATDPNYLKLVRSIMTYSIGIDNSDAVAKETI